MTKKELEKEITWKEREFELTGKKDWALLDEINALKKECEEMESKCDINDEFCESCSG